MVQKVFPLSMLNFMLFNAYFAWNISAETMLPNCLKATNSYFYAALSEKRITFTERIDDIHGGELWSYMCAQGNVPVGAELSSQGYHVSFPLCLLLSHRSHSCSGQLHLTSSLNCNFKFSLCQLEQFFHLHCPPTKVKTLCSGNFLG